MDEWLVGGPNALHLPTGGDLFGRAVANQAMTISTFDERHVFRGHTYSGGEVSPYKIEGKSRFDAPNT